MNGVEEGIRGERLAERFLVETEGYRVVAKNKNFAGVGELDLVCYDGETLAFIEVRSRSSEIAGHPFDTVDRKKRAKFVRAAEAFLDRERPEYRDVRFDLVAVTGDRVELLKDAFYGRMLR